MAPPEIVSTAACLVPTIKELPILFSAAMVRALLDGTKTQTRRVVKPPRSWLEFSNCDPFAMPPFVWWWNGEQDRVGVRQDCTYGKPGDKLRVREAWCAENSSTTWRPVNSPPAARSSMKPAVTRPHGAANCARAYSCRAGWRPPTATS